MDLVTKPFYVRELGWSFLQYSQTGGVAVLVILAASGWVVGVPTASDTSQSWRSASASTVFSPPPVNCRPASDIALGPASCFC